MISERIYDDIPPQMKILNMVIPILMHFCIMSLSLSVASHIKPHVISQDILSQNLDVIQSDVALQTQVH